MISTPSVQHEFTLIYSGDPALELPDIEPSANDADKERILEERERLLKMARETGNWPLRADASPTLFKFADLTRSDISWWAGESKHSARFERPLSEAESSDLLFRLALRNVENFGKHTVKRSKYPGGVWLADEAIVNALFEAAGSSPLIEFTAVVWERAQASGLRPLS